MGFEAPLVGDGFIGTQTMAGFVNRARIDGGHAEFAQAVRMSEFFEWAVESVRTQQAAQVLVQIAGQLADPANLPDQLYVVLGSRVEDVRVGRKFEMRR